MLYLHFTMDDNLSLSEKIKERYRRMYSGVFFKRYILGLWVLAEGIIYDMFNDEEHVVPTEDRPYSRYYVACDYGIQNPTTFGLYGKFNGRWYKVKEYYYSGRDTGKQKTDTEFADDYETFIGGLKIEATIIDPSASSFIAELRKRGHRVLKAKNDVVDGIRVLSTLLKKRWILYNDCCINTFREFNSYSWDPKASERGEDKPIKEHDHALDADRYFAYTILRHLVLTTTRKSKSGKGARTA